MTRSVRIGNCSGFYGDRIDAAREMVESGDVDVVCGEIAATVAHVEGDDLRGDLDAVTPVVSGKPVSANAYLGGWGIAEALAAGADVVVTGRVSDASLVVGPAAWW